MSTPDTPSAANTPADVPGARHLRVGIVVGRRSVRVTSVALAPGAPASPLAAGHPWLAAVSVGDQVVHLARFQDPLVQRSTRTRDGGDHHLSDQHEGLVVVSVPFGSMTDLSRTRIEVLDLRQRPGLVTREELLGELGRRRSGGRDLPSLGFEQIAAARGWPRVAELLGIPTPHGTFEIYRDAAGEYRWRLRAVGRGIVAVSGEGFRTRAECEAEVTWIRRYAAGAPVRPLDGPTRS
ncbi:MAG TPA: DUF1508 domain-containing protein [Dermatophilaceae bacterium]|nr:DUF1508 domain-containing protein [Dermatophilaceae bacterium]